MHTLICMLFFCTEKQRNFRVNVAFKANITYHNSSYCTLYLLCLRSLRFCNLHLLPACLTRRAGSRCVAYLLLDRYPYWVPMAIHHTPVTIWTLSSWESTPRRYHITSVRTQSSHGWPSSLHCDWRNKLEHLGPGRRYKTTLQTKTALQSEPQCSDITATLTSKHSNILDKFKLSVFL